MGYGRKNKKNLLPVELAAKVVRNKPQSPLFFLSSGRAQRAA